MNKGVFSEEFENGNREIKKEKLEDMDIKVETLHHSIDIKEEISAVEPQFDEDCNIPISKFESELKVDIASKTDTDRLLCNFGLEPHSIDDLISTSNDSTESTIQDTPASSTKYCTRSCSPNNGNKGRRRTRKDFSNISAMKEKLQLQIEYLKLQNRLTKLETLKLKQQLKLSKLKLNNKS